MRNPAARARRENPGLQFPVCQPRGDRRAGGRPDPEGEAQEGREKRDPRSAGAKPQPEATRFPGAPSGGGGAGGRRGEPTPQGKAPPGAAQKSKQAQHARRKKDPGAQPRKAAFGRPAPGAGAAQPPKPVGTRQGGPGDPHKEPGAWAQRARATGAQQRKPAAERRTGPGDCAGAADCGARKRAQRRQLWSRGAAAGGHNAAGAPPRSGPAQGKGPRGKWGRDVGIKGAGISRGTKAPAPGAHTFDVRGNSADSRSIPDSQVGLGPSNYCECPRGPGWALWRQFRAVCVCSLLRALS